MSVIQSLSMLCLAVLSIIIYQSVIYLSQYDCQPVSLSICQSVTQNNLSACVTKSVYQSVCESVSIIYLSSVSQYDLSVSQSV